MPDAMQRALALVLGVVSAPLLAALALAVRADSPGGALFVAERVGEGGRTFGLLKLRTMRRGAATDGPGISVAGDSRITRVGRILRRTRLDEIPQFWNVVRGEMRLVGPRPEDPRFVDLADPTHRIVFMTRPGITGPAQILHVDESSLVDGDEPEAAYRAHVLPAKVALDAAYLNHRSTTLDLWILGQTILTLAGRPPGAGQIEARLGIVASDASGGVVPIAREVRRQ